MSEFKQKLSPKIVPYIAIFVIPVAYFDNRISTEYFWSKSFWLNLLAYGGILWWIWESFKYKKPWELYIGRTTVPVILFVTLAAISMLWSHNYYKSSELILKVGGSVGIYFLITNYFQKREDVISLIEVSFIAAFIVIFYGLLQYTEILYLPRDQYGQKDPSTTIGLTNFVLHYIVLIIPSYVGFLGITKSNVKRALIVIGMIPLYYYFFIAENRASLTGVSMEIIFALLLLGVFVYMKKSRTPFPLKTIAATLGVLIVGAYLILYQTESGRTIRRKFSTVFHPSQYYRDDSIRFRLETWKKAPMIIKDHPFGLGLANLEIYFPLYYTPYLINMTLHNNTRVVRSHNDYVQTLVDLGIEGFLILLWLLLAIASIMITLLKKIDTWDDFWLFWSISTGIVGFLIVMFFSFPLQEPTASLYLWSFLGLLEVLKKIHNKGNIKSLKISSNGLKSFLIIFSGAVFLLTVILSYRGFRAEVFYKEARLLKSIRHWEESKVLLDDAIKSNPTMEGFYYDRAVSLMKMGQINAALKDLEQTAKMVPYYGIGRQQLGYLYYQMGNCDKAIPHLLVAYKVYYTEPLKYATYIISCYEREHKFNNAIKIGEETFRRIKSDFKNKKLLKKKKFIKKLSDFLRAFGNVYILNGNYKKGKKILSLSLKYAPTADAATNLGVILIRERKYPKAVSILTQALTINPGEAKAWYNRAQAYYLIGEKKKAISDFKKAFDLDPSLKFKAKISKFFLAHKELMKLLK